MTALPDSRAVEHVACELSRRSRVRQRSEAVAHRLAFTPREMQTLYLTLIGRSRKQIAMQLRISESMIDVYRRSLFEKAGVRNATHLIRHAMTAGWIGMGTTESAASPGA